jgi:molybdopterin synthase sulfur carrier subunit
MAPPDAPLRILYFAWLRERVGRSEEQVRPPPHVTRIGELVAWLTDLDPAHAAAFATPGVVRCAVNQDFATADTPVAPGDEIAFFPPVTGG